MNRRGFLAMLAAIPFVGKLVPKAEARQDFVNGDPTHWSTANCAGVIDFPGRQIVGLYSVPGHLVVEFNDGTKCEVIGESVWNFRVKDLK